MKILSIGNFGRGWDGSICDEEHIAKALESLGHQVKRWQRENVVDWQFKKNPSLLEVFEKTPDFILIAQWSEYDEGLLINLKQAYERVPIVYWAFDYQADGQEWHERLVKQADLYLSKRIADSKYPNWQYLSQDFAPQFLKKHPQNIEKDIDVLFTGSYLPWADERNKTIEAVNKNFNLVVHSVNDWPFLERRPPIMDEGLSELYARAKVILSIDHTLEAGYWSDRNAQIIACGGFALTRYIPLMETVFRNNVAYFYSVEDCLELVKWWLEHDEDREVFAAEAYDNAWQYKVKERTADMLTVVRSII